MEDDATEDDRRLSQPQGFMSKKGKKEMNTVQRGNPD